MFADWAACEFSASEGMLASFTGESHKYVACYGRPGIRCGIEFKERQNAITRFKSNVDVPFEMTDEKRAVCAFAFNMGMQPDYTKTYRELLRWNGPKDHGSMSRLTFGTVQMQPESHVERSIRDADDQLIIKWSNSWHAALTCIPHSNPTVGPWMRVKYDAICSDSAISIYGLDDSPVGCGLVRNLDKNGFDRYLLPDTPTVNRRNARLSQGSEEDPQQRSTNLTTLERQELANSNYDAIHGKDTVRILTHFTQLMANTDPMEVGFGSLETLDKIVTNRISGSLSGWDDLVRNLTRTGDKSAKINELAAAQILSCLRLYDAVDTLYQVSAWVPGIHERARFEWIINRPGLRMLAFPPAIVKRMRAGMEGGANFQTDRQRLIEEVEEYTDEMGICTRKVKRFIIGGMLHAGEVLQASCKQAKRNLEYMFTLVSELVDLRWEEMDPKMQDWLSPIHLHAGGMHERLWKCLSNVGESISCLEYCLCVTSHASIPMLAQAWSHCGRSGDLSRLENALCIFAKDFVTTDRRLCQAYNRRDDIAPYYHRNTKKFLLPETLFWTCIAVVGTPVISSTMPRLACANMQDPFLSNEYKKMAKQLKHLQNQDKYPFRVSPNSTGNQAIQSILQLLSHRKGPNRGYATPSLHPMVMKVPTKWDDGSMLYWPSGWVGIRRELDNTVCVHLSLHFCFLFKWMGSVSHRSN